MPTSSTVALAPSTTRCRSRRTSTSGAAARSSHHTQQASSTTAATATPIRPGEPHPQLCPSARASRTAVTPAPSSSAPGRSRWRCGRSPLEGNTATASTRASALTAAPTQNAAGIPRYSVTRPITG
ncbi:MAG TPA: hypothetical protein VFW65_25755 [Pseudonocardiaceae bacterium]|nr:hypothetical protein [Pseudonocardiaceae bacterium]